MLPVSQHDCAPKFEYKVTHPGPEITRHAIPELFGGGTSNAPHPASRDPSRWGAGFPWRAKGSFADPAGQSPGPVRGASAGIVPQARTGVEPAHDTPSLPLAAPSSIGPLISALSAALISCLLINERGPVRVL